MISLSKKQRQFFDYLSARIKETGVCPSYEELAEHFGYKSLNSVVHMIKALKERGAIEHNSHGKRDIRVVEGV